MTRWDFRTRDDLVTIVHRSRDLGFNRIYLQVRGRADALYRSSLEPWAEEIGGRDPGYDPLEVATREARDAGIELHAWVNVLSGWKGKSPPSDRTHVVHRHPDWFLLDRFQKRHIYDDHYTILNPCLEDVREHIAKVIEDIARRYPIDGVQLDYIRFIAESARDRQAVPYDNLTLRQFRLENDGDFPIRRPQEWDAFRRRAIDTLVERIARGVRTIRPTAVISAAVIRDFDRARSHYFQDATKWVSARWVDEIVTMNYERELPRFEHHLATAIERAGANRVIAGIGAYLIGTPADVAAQIESSLRHGARGWAIFAYTDLFPSRSHESKSGADAERRRAEM
ncbi:MAG TPA: family 10 glycosylhydrolase, partial [Planctomycetota bacterium]|nr:family 10 glycosylhydrolase [Planctomycetota bacterium]